MQLVSEMESKVMQLQTEWKDLTDDELLDMDISLLRQLPGERPAFPDRIIKTMAMNSEMARRRISWEQRIARLDETINNMQKAKGITDYKCKSEQDQHK